MSVSTVATTAKENKIWDKYLADCEKYLDDKMPKNGAKNIQQINIIGSNLVKMRSSKVTAAGLYARLEGVKGGKQTAAHKMLSSI